MSEQTILQKVSEEACRFIYKRYFLDEISNGKDTLMYCCGDRMIVNIFNAQDHFDFLFIFNKDEYDRLEGRRGDFPPEILGEYNPVKNGDTGWSIRVSVCDMKSWELAKELMLIKMTPNRESWPEDTRIKSVNGGRCDMCVRNIHHASDDDDYKKYVKARLDDRWGDDCGHDSPCPGQQAGCGGVFTVGLPFGMSTSADTLTYGLLPFIKDLM